MPTFKKLLLATLTFSLLISPFFLSLRTNAATQTIAIPKNNVVNSEGYFVGPSGGNTWGDVGGGAPHSLSTDVNANLAESYNNAVGAAAFSRGWNFNFDIISCTSYKPLSLTATSIISAGEVSSAREDVVTSAAINGQSALPALSRSYGVNGVGALGAGYENATVAGNDADPSGNSNFTSIAGGVEVRVVYDVSSLTPAELSQVVVTWLVDPEYSSEGSSVNSPVVTAPSAELTYDDTDCQATGSPVPSAPKTAGITSSSTSLILTTVLGLITLTVLHRIIKLRNTG